MKEKRIAVVTDVIDERFFFPMWKKYYGDLFGYNNLFVVTYLGGASIDAREFGGVVRLPTGYSDEIRCRFISEFVQSLLSLYDIVIRVDADEFIVCDPRKYTNIKAYLDQTKLPYVTARGFDIIQLSEQPDLKAGSLLRQRQYAYPNSALNKTCVTTIPIKWLPGFHFSSVYPRCDEVFILHLKRVDINTQMAWFARMTDNISNNSQVPDELREYYRVDIEKLLAYHQSISIRRKVSGVEEWYRTSHQDSFFSSIFYDPKSNCYRYPFAHDPILCEVPHEWQDLLFITS